VLTDFASYLKWNPFIHRIRGEPREGTRLKIYIEPSGEKGRIFRPKVLKAEAKREPRWIGRLLPPGLFDGDQLRRAIGDRNVMNTDQSKARNSLPSFLETFLM